MRRPTVPGADAARHTSATLAGATAREAAPPMHTAPFLRCVPSSHAVRGHVDGVDILKLHRLASASFIGDDSFSGSKCTNGDSPISKFHCLEGAGGNDFVWKHALNRQDIIPPPYFVVLQVQFIGDDDFA